MDAADFQSALSCGVAETFGILGQTVIWNKTPVLALVDDLPYSTEQRGGGGGFIEEFRGSLLFCKSDFTVPHFPKVGDDVQIGRRKVRIVEVANLDDAADPTLHCFYKPVST